jgi:hypothetical protein
MNLQLSLKTKWFEMTKAGVKTEDYREITPYFVKRFLLYQGKCIGVKTGWNTNQIEDITNDIIAADGDIELLDYVFNNWYLSFKPFITNIMTLGYPKVTDTKRFNQLEHKGFGIRTGNPEWGAEQGKLYFVIKHGQII